MVYPFTRGNLYNLYDHVFFGIKGPILFKNNGHRDLKYLNLFCRKFHFSSVIRQNFIVYLQ